MSLKETIAADLIVAMKAREKLKVSTLRMTLSAFTYVEKDKRRELTDEEMLETVGREVKKRRESITEYTKAGRTDLSDKEEAEVAILAVYLPEQLSDAVLREIIETAVRETGASGPGDIGKVMGSVIPKTKGRADGKKINEIVRSLLAD